MTPELFAILLNQARQGCQKSLGELLEQHRNYLCVIANSELDPELIAKVGGSDLVQQTFAEAHQALHQFDGQRLEEFLPWLRRILLNNVVDLKREYLGTAARNIRLERPCTDSRPLEQYPADQPTPSSELAEAEAARRLNEAMAQLSEEHRQVIEWRNRDRLRFAVIGERIGRSPDAARMLWQRAVNQLQAILGSDHST